MNIFFNAVKSQVHSAYQELINYPPHDIFYLLNSEKNFSVSRLATSSTYFCRLPNMSLCTTKAEVDLIHSPQQMVLTKKPWVICFEHASALAFNQKNLRYRINKKIISKFLSTRRCRKIMPWCNAAGKSLENAIDTRKFSEKIEVVYPAMHEVDFTRQNSKSVNIIFVGRCFHRKGGIEVLKAFETLNKKYDIKLSMVSQAPTEVINRYKNYHGIEFLTNMSRQSLIEKHFANFDIFVLPTSYDTFGMAFLEAMAFGLPIVTLEGFATPEIVEDGKNGYLIKPYSKLWFGDDYLHHPIWGEWKALKSFLSNKEQDRIVSDLVDKLSILIENDSLRKKMGEYGRSLIERGKFSIKERNKKLERIYKEAIE